MAKPILDPRHEYISDFVLPDEAADLFARLEQVDGFHLETGSCTLKPSHATVQWGPRQSYLDCVPKAYRAKSSGDIPEWLIPLKLRLEKKYNCYFDSIQVNKHFNENAIVHAHSDSPPGHICMVSLGAERNFKISLRFGSHRTLANIPLANGSVLTFFPKDQWRHTHEMPRSKTPCGARYALVFRYITDALVREGAIKTAVAFRLLDKQGKMERKQRNIERNAEYDAVQAAYRSGGYAAVEQCLRLKPWTGAAVTPTAAVREADPFDVLDLKAERQVEPAETGGTIQAVENPIFRAADISARKEIKALRARVKQGKLSASDFQNIHDEYTAVWGGESARKRGNIPI